MLNFLRVAIRNLTRNRAFSMINDSNFFRLFNYSFTYGNAATAVDVPNSLVISEKLAHKFFDRENPLGRSLKIATPFGEFDYTIKGVFDEEKSKSHIPASYFLSMRNNDMWNWVQQQTPWINNNVFYTYTKLRPGTSPIAFTKKLNAFHDRHAGAEMRAAGFSKTLFLKQTAHADEKGYLAMKNELGNIPGITGVSSASGYPGNSDLSDMLVYGEGKK